MKGLPEWKREHQVDRRENSQQVQLVLIYILKPETTVLTLLVKCMFLPCYDPSFYWATQASVKPTQPSDNFPLGDRGCQYKLPQLSRGKGILITRQHPQQVC